jgi:hypothetical protein
MASRGHKQISDSPPRELYAKKWTRRVTFIMFHEAISESWHV